MSDVPAGFDIPELKTSFVFRRQPVAIPGDLRPVWKIGLIVFIVNKCCRGGRTSLTRLHVLSWGIRSSESRDALHAAIEGQLSPDSLIVRFEPFLNRALDFAIGEGLVRRLDGKKIEVTTKGRSLADEISAAKDAYMTEKTFIHLIGQRLTEDLVNKMFSRGT
jgi:hypothetical protein